MDSKQLLHSGQLYDSSLCDLVDEQQRLLEKLYDFNSTRPSQQEERQRLMKEMFGDIGKDCYIEPRSIPIGRANTSTSATASTPTFR